MVSKKRNYGHDSIVQTRERSSKSNINTIDVIRFYFDNAISKTRNFIIFLILVSAVIAIFLLGLQYAFYPERFKFGFDQWWFNFAKLLGIGAGEFWGDRLINFLFAALGVTISATVIGFISKGISNATEKLKKGKSKIIVENHILILGWSNNIYALVSELLKANSNIKTASIVILSSHENQKMQDLLDLNLDKNLSGKIITRSGDITNPRDIQIVNPGGAKSIIILSGNSTKDLDVKLSLMAIYSFVSHKDNPVIAQIHNKKSLRELAQLKNINLIPVYDYDVLVKVCAQSIRQKGIGRVVLDFMDFDGNEIYYFQEPALIGKMYQEAIMSFSEACVIGLYSSSGKVLLNPEKSYIINENDKIIAVAEDDHKISYSPASEIKELFSIEDISKAQGSRNILIIGWSQFARDVLQSYLPFKNENQKLFVAFDEEYFEEPEQIKKDISSDNRIEMVCTFNSGQSVTNIIQLNNIDTVLILPYNESHSNDEADTLTLLKMIELNSFNSEQDQNKVRVIAYLLDSGKTEIASFTKTEELIISDNLSALLIAQYSENPHLVPLFKDIFDVEGASINLIQASELINPGKEILFSEIIYHGIQKGFSVLGIQSENAGIENIRLNIPKNERVILNAGDHIIAICG